MLKAGIAHLWFVTIHPFEDGNGRIARAIADMALAAPKSSRQRFYSMSAQIRLERKDYYDMLESTQKGDLEITHWLEWFLGCLDRAHRRRRDYPGGGFRQGALLADACRRCTLQRASAQHGQPTAGRIRGKAHQRPSGRRSPKARRTPHLRDINDLIEHGVLKKDTGGGRSTSYSLIIPQER